MHQSIDKPPYSPEPKGPSGSADRAQVVAPTVAPVDECGDDDQSDGESELIESVDDAGVGVSAKSPVV